jgi:hypothetical protein
VLRERQARQRFRRRQELMRQHSVRTDQHGPEILT